MIKQAIINDPMASDREIARRVNVSQPTVGVVRAEMTSGLNDKSYQRDQSRPIERAKSVLRENPNLKKREVMEKAKVGSKVAVNARRKLAADPPPAREEQATGSAANHS